LSLLVVAQVPPHAWVPVVQTQVPPLQLALPVQA
jgi:hypothetical protein